MNDRRSALPTLYIPHGGGPCFFMDWNPPGTWDKMAAWLRGLGASIGEKPKAVVVISGHWERDEFTVASNARPPLIYDYSGFPPHTYELKYLAPGSPTLAHRVRELLGNAGITSRLDAERGFDHGVFIPFKLIYPNADVPIVQLSLRAALDPAAHIRVGEALSKLRNERVLIVGSGMSYHNMRGFGGAAQGPSDTFDTWLTGAVTGDAKTRNEELAQWQNAPAARQSHPREEHLIPLMVAAGAAGEDVGRKIFSDRVMGATVSAYQFG
ncbi:MAG: dioxygenase [Acidobacteriaceae bacterium]|nr:dioxygenase [Acidobacteriaceae bacterium]